MSYLYDKLKEVLGGSNFKSGVVNTTWSPNEVRALFIMTNYIMAVDYIKQPKVVMLDVNEVFADIQNPNRRGYLNNVLTSRQLSCIEEIYVSSEYMNYPQVIGLQEYINSLVSQSSRLRYWGYIVEPNLNNLRSIYQSVIINTKMDFLYVKAVGGGGSFFAVDNPDWYKKHNLRPEYYSLDKEKGNLYTYFMKCEKSIEEGIKANNDKIKSLGIVNSICSMYNIDCALAGNLLRLIKLLTFCSKNSESPIRDIASIIYKNVIKTGIITKGMSKDTFISSMKAGKTSISKDNEKYILNAYSKFNVYDIDDSNKDDVVFNDDGILQLRKRIDLGLYEALKTYGKNYKSVFLSTILRYRNEHGVLPEGKFTNELISMKMPKIDTNGGTEDLISFVYNICGFTEEDFLMIIKNTNGGSR